MGDLLMSSPAIGALKETFNCSITVLTSSMAAEMARHIPYIDEVLVADVPWVRSDFNERPAGYLQLVDMLAEQQFDAAVIFSVFSQNPMPAILLAFLAQIPLRLAYCRENPYQLLTDWVPDEEPYTLIRHQVERDLALVKFVGAESLTEKLSLTVPKTAYDSMWKKIEGAGCDMKRPWIIVHPGASEPKRLFPPERFIQILKRILTETDVQLVFTGTGKEKSLIEELRAHLPDRTSSAAGLFSLQEFMALIDIAPAVLSVNTGTVHIAAALQTPVAVLYAQSNPQHTPWKVPHKVFYYPIEENLKSKNEILKWVDQHAMSKSHDYPSPAAVADGIIQLLQNVPQQQP
jgi:lipopolysaccharide heptosyltransferase II